MTKYGRRIVVLAVAIVLTVSAATAWLAFAQEEEPDITQLPGAFELVGDIPTEAIPFYDGDIPFLGYLSRGRALRLVPVDEVASTVKAPPLVSPRARYAQAYDDAKQGDTPPVVFFVDESKGEGAGHDRLYADRNADGVFDADESVGLMADPPAGAIVPISPGVQCVVFEPFEMQFKPDGPARRVVARLLVDVDGSSEYLFAGEGLRRARVTLGGVECSVFMSAWFPSDFDEQLGRRIIEYAPGEIGESWQHSLWSTNGEVYRLSVAWRGDTLTLERYVGEKGTVALEMEGPWKGATVKQFSMGGANPSLDVAGTLLEEKGEFAAPVGRYYAAGMSVTKGVTTSFLMRLPVQEDKHAMRLRVSSGDRRRFTLEATPEVVFSKPEKRMSVRRGGNVAVEALIECPELELCVRAISIRLDEGNSPSSYRQLDPRVTVRDSGGNIVAEGSMPFG